MAHPRIRKIREIDRVFLEHVLGGRSFGEHAHPAFVALRGSDPVGLLIYALRPEGCEILLLHTPVERIGLGSALVREVKRAARRARCDRVWVRLDAGDTHTRRFYERNGFNRTDRETESWVLEHPLHARRPDTTAL